MTVVAVETIKKILLMTFCLILSQNLFAKSFSFAYCGEKVVCQGDHTCTMIDGDYHFFKAFVVGKSFHTGTFQLNKVFVWNNTKSQKAACFYSTPPGSDMVIQFWSLPNYRFGIAIYYPASDGWIYNDPETTPSTGEHVWSCDASKYECRMESL